MRVISKSTLKEFYQKHADAKLPIEMWYAIVSESEWNNLADIKATFNSVDFVGNDRYVFNIKGNRYRIVAMIFFVPRIVYIRFVGTHAEYDKISGIENI